MACGKSVPQPALELVPPALGAWSLNHYTTIEVSYSTNYDISKQKISNIKQYLYNEFSAVMKLQIRAKLIHLASICLGPNV